MAHPSTEKHQQTSLRRATKHGKPWHEWEVKMLRKMSAEGHSAAVMALALERSLYGVYSKLERIRKNG